VIKLIGEHGEKVRKIKPEYIMFFIRKTFNKKVSLSKKGLERLKNIWGLYQHAIILFESLLDNYIENN